MGLVYGLLAVLGFSFSLPATRAAVEDLDATFVGLGRAVAAGLLAAALLALTRQPLPQRRHLPNLALVVGGVVIGFPLFTALALRELTSAHGAVMIAVIPAATAVAAVLLAGERPSRGFWAAGSAGLVAVLAFAASRGTGLPTGSDLMLLGAVALVVLGYAGGGALARELGGWQVICWALVGALPLLIPVTAVAVADGGVAGEGDTAAWLGFGYVSLVSMFLGFFAWYAAMARAGVAKTGQLMLVMPLLTLVWSALVLGESVSAGTVAAALAVLGCVFATQRARVDSAADQPGHQQEHGHVHALVDHDRDDGVGAGVGLLHPAYVGVQEPPVVLDHVRERHEREGGGGLPGA
jgi:drug/metabolite transporter (DMT)-like permease